MSDPNSERETGLLTENQRQYLRQEKEEVSSQTKKRTKVRIRQRFRNGLIDASLLFRTLDEQDIEQIFSPMPHAEQDRKDVIDGTIDLLAICEIGFGKAGVPFELAIEEAIKRAETYRGTPLEDIEVTITREREPSNMARVTVRSETANQLGHTEKELLNDLVESGNLDLAKLIERSSTPERVREWAKDQSDP